MMSRIAFFISYFIVNKKRLDVDKQASVCNFVCKCIIHENNSSRNYNSYYFIINYC